MQSSEQIMKPPNFQGRKNSHALIYNMQIISGLQNRTKTIISQRVFYVSKTTKKQAFTRFKLTGSGTALYLWYQTGEFFP